MNLTHALAEGLAENNELAALPCSQSQKRFWFETRLDPHNPALNVAVRWRLEGKVMHAHLEEAWRLIIARHQTLRASFVTIGGEPRQIIAPAVAFRVPLVDLTALDDEAAAAEAERLASLEAKRTFDITKAPLIRVTHIRVRPDVSMILVTAHHTVCDGWSVGVLAAEMGEICDALDAGRTPAPPDITLTYADYVAREREWLAETNGTHRDEIARRWEGFEQFEILPDKPRPPIQTPNGEILSVLLDRELTDALAQLARKNHCTLFMVAYAALLAVLHRYSGHADITIGTQFAGRDEVEFEKLVGTFVNTVALRTEVDGEVTFGELLESARDTVTDAFEQRYIPLEELIEIVNPKRDLSRNALFSINFVFQRSFIKNQTYGSFTLVDLPSRSAAPICDLNFFMVERPEGWRASCEFNLDLFERETVNRMLQRWVMVLRTIARDPSCPISALPLVDAAERARLLEAFNATQADYPQHQLVHQLFEAQVRKNPDAPAVVFERESLSYGELNRRANRLANYLRNLGVGPDRLVAICVERSLEMVVGLLGILKAGAAYVPLDPAYPAERIAYMLEDASPSVVLTQERLRPVLPQSQAPAVSLDVDWDVIGAYPDTDPDASGLSSGNLAYVIYTSGSTGQPKGVMLEHGGLCNLAVVQGDRFKVDGESRVLQFASLSFDAATMELVMALCNGAALHVASPKTILVGDALFETLRDRKISHTLIPPAVLAALPEGELPHLRVLLSGADVVTEAVVQRWAPGRRLINAYGPTEATVFVTLHECDAEEHGNPPIGRPIANARIYILDERLEPVPTGVAGELYIGGAGVARGYLNRPELTAQQFIASPFVAGDRLYKTGDLARYRADGAVEYLGRNDFQVKIRGFRIELGEIETRLSQHAAVGQAVVIAREDRPGGKRLVAYYTLASVGATDDSRSMGQRLRSYLSEGLPDYMLPAAFVRLQTLPLTPNGKLDRRALPAPDGNDANAHVVDPPSTAVERTIAQILRELDLEPVSRQDDFFDLGGHSLLAVRFIARLHDTLGVDLHLRVLFENPTIAAIAAHIEEAKLDEEHSAAAPILTLNAGGTRTPFIYFHSDLFANGLYARHLAAALGTDQPVHLIAPHGTAGLPLLPTIEDMARDYERLIRKVQPTGPYRLGGYCASGLAAYELARILREKGEVVERLVLLNSSPMSSRSIGIFDALIRHFGVDQRLEPHARDRICYNLARLHAAVLRGPRATLSLFANILRAHLSGRSPTFTNAREPQPFEKHRGERSTEISYAHLVAAFTYHPKPHDGNATLIWGEDQETTFEDPTKGWGTLVRRITVESVEGGHVGAVHQRIDDLAHLLKTVLGDRPL